MDEGRRARRDKGADRHLREKVKVRHPHLSGVLELLLQTAKVLQALLSVGEAPTQLRRRRGLAGGVRSGRIMSRECQGRAEGRG